VRRRRRTSETAAEPTAGTCQQSLAAFDEHPTKPFRTRELQEFLGPPTDEATMNITRSRLARQGVLTRPGRGLYRTDVAAS
jgi:predicted transcriptional regulator of viral defense system